MILDLVGGIGDLIMKFLCIVGDFGRVVLFDINLFMLQVGCDKLFDYSYVGNIEYVQVNVESLFFVDNSFDCIIIVFGLCNVIDK